MLFKAAVQGEVESICLLLSLGARLLGLLLTANSDPSYPAVNQSRPRRGIHRPVRRRRIQPPQHLVCREVAAPARGRPVNMEQARPYAARRREGEVPGPVRWHQQGQHEDTAVADEGRCAKALTGQKGVFVVGLTCNERWEVRLDGKTKMIVAPANYGPGGARSRGEGHRVWAEEARRPQRAGGHRRGGNSV